MRKAVFFSFSVITVLSACGRTPAEPENRTRVESAVEAGNNTSVGDSASRGGNLMGSGH